MSQLWAQALFEDKKVHRLAMVRGGADSDFLMKPVSECYEKPVLPGFSEEKKGIWNRQSGFSGSYKTRIPPLGPLFMRCVVAGVQQPSFGLLRSYPSPQSIFFSCTSLTILELDMVWDSLTCCSHNGNYYVCCLEDVFLNVLTHLQNSIQDRSAVQSCIVPRYRMLHVNGSRSVY